jgi:diphthamide synthase (EF-2-diphthine--ammonia ligase)
MMLMYTLSGGHDSASACSSSLYKCDEANLDVEWIMAVSQGTPTTFMYWNASYNSWITFLTTIANTEKPPLVISISYGAKESAFSPTYMKHFNIQAMKLAAQGAGAPSCCCISPT